MQNEQQFLTSVNKILHSKSQGAIDSFVGSYIQEHKNTKLSPKEGMFPLFLRIAAGRRIRDDQSRELQSLVHESIQNTEGKPSITQEVLDSLQILKRQVDTYFRVSTMDSDYFVIPAFEDSLANMMLDLECQRIASTYREKFQSESKENYVIEPFKKDGKGYGVWMSKNNVALNLTKVEV